VNPGGIVLIEPWADRPAGHWHHALAGLARAQQQAGGAPAIVVALNGIAPVTRRELAGTGAVLAVRPPPSCPAGWLLMAAARAAAGTARALLSLTRRRPGLPVPVRRFPHQVTMISRCLTEAASLRTGRALAPGVPRVILTASEALHTTAAVAGGGCHLRIVHEVFTTEDAPLRALTAATRSASRRVRLICTTSAVAGDVTARFPGLGTVTMPYALTAPGDYLSAAERDAARAALINGRETGPVAVLAGGWWPHKDPQTVIEAFTLVRSRWRLLAAGHPLDPRLLTMLARNPLVHVQAEDRDLQPDEMRRLYAAADATIISRHPGAAKESGLLMDAIRHGIPVIVSSHDPGLAAYLRDQEWARVFRAGDPASLAAVLDGAADRPPARPGPGEAARTGLLTPAQALGRFAALHADLEREAREHSPDRRHRARRARAAARLR
jgi:glycosyltransferase involved in cell wall biosynthesis